MKTKHYNISNFNKINAIGNYKFKITQSDCYSLKIVSSKDNLEKLSIFVKNNILHFEPKQDKTVKDIIKVYASLPKIRDINLLGNNNLNLVKLVGEKLSISISGTGLYSFKGFVEEAKIESSGLNEVNMQNLATTKCYLKVIGKGTVFANAKKELNIKILGEGKVFYTGNPVITRQIIGKGTVEKKI